MKKTLIATFLVVFLAMAGITYAFTCVTTCDTSEVSKGANITCNATGTWVAGTDDHYNMTNGTIEFASAALSPNTTWFEAKKVDDFNQWMNGTNTSVIGQFTYNITVTEALVAGLVDATDYQVRMKVKNATAADTSASEVTCSATTGILVDKGKPTCTMTGITTSGVYDLANTNTVTVSSDNGTSSARLNFGGEFYSMTQGSWSGITRSYTYDISVFPDGTYDVYSDVTDGTNRTTCTQVNGVTLAKYIRGGAATAGAKKAEAQKKGIQAPPVAGLQAKILGIPIWLVLGVIILVIYGKSKKGKKWF